MDVIAPILTGGAFGFLLERGKTNLPVVIVEQMAFHEHTMLRMFLGASISSIGVMTAFHAAGIHTRCTKGGLALGFGLMGGYGANIVGGALLGMGMTLTGSCPGTVWAQLGSGQTEALFVLLGGILGVIAFGYMDGYLQQRTKKFHERKAPVGVDIEAGVSYTGAGLGFMAAMSAVVLTVNRFQPWELASKQWLSPEASLSGTFPSVDLSLSQSAWDPLWAGVLVGLLQIPAMLSNGTGLGNSSGFVNITKKIISVVDPNYSRNAPYFNKAGSVWQMTSAIGIMTGAYLSSYLSAQAVNGPVLSDLASQSVGSPVQKIIGGFILLFGARVAGGCTSGHGLTGLATLSMSSLLSVAAMFGGGMGLKFLMG
eukprot:m.114850 g.114850  ORF g.114850 m.114850 type:complete len:369 (-) comp14181_c0_seq3:192-1298(-)